MTNCHDRRTKRQGECQSTSADAKSQTNAPVKNRQNTPKITRKIARAIQTAGNGDPCFRQFVFRTFLGGPTRAIANNDRRFSAYRSVGWQLRQQFEKTLNKSAGCGAVCRSMVLRNRSGRSSGHSLEHSSGRSPSRRFLFGWPSAAPPCGDLHDAGSNRLI